MAAAKPLTDEEELAAHQHPAWDGSLHGDVAGTRALAREVLGGKVDRPLRHEPGTDLTVAAAEETARQLADLERQQRAEAARQRRRDRKR